jgi:hypothetical protein
MVKRHFVAISSFQLPIVLLAFERQILQFADRDLRVVGAA